MSKVIFVVDGEFMRKRIIGLKAFYFDGSGIRNHCMTHLTEGDELVKILYYDSFPYTGKGEHPITGPVDFSATPLVARKQQFLQSLRTTPNIHLRLGRSAWQAGQWVLDAPRLGELVAGEITYENIKAEDIYPDIRQKGVDMRMGLDLAAIAYKKLADMVVIISNDADFTPAVKVLREEGIKVILDPLWTRAAEDLRENIDYVFNALPRPKSEDYPHGIHIFNDPKELSRLWTKEEDDLGNNARILKPADK